MQIFKSKKMNVLFMFYRLLSPVFDPVRFGLGLYGYFWFLKDAIKYQRMDKKNSIFNLSLFPLVHEKTPLTSFDGHYFYQQIWCFEKVLKNKAKNHVDVASTYALSGYISRIKPTIFVDIRPIKTNLKNLKITKGDILNLPYNDNSITSLSCFHVAEHIGLGRYGDSLNDKGTEQACKELSRVLASGGFLYFSLPIGKNRICFNAHRIHTPQRIINYFKDLRLISFSVVDDQGNFFENVDYRKYDKLNYGNGMFIFKKS